MLIFKRNDLKYIFHLSVNPPPPLSGIFICIYICTSHIVDVASSPVYRCIFLQSVTGEPICDRKIVEIC